LTTIVLIRHAENDWVRSGKLAGWTSGVHLNDEGKRQAEALSARLANVKLRAIYSSPLERAVETAEAIVSHQPDLTIQLEPDIGEAHYGQWTGESIRKLARTRLWQVVQSQPSRAQFPDGETLREMQSRAVGAVERICISCPNGFVAIISHADVIKSVVAHYVGMHLDMFQRLLIAPASISIISLHKHGPILVRLNDTHHYDRPNHGPEGES
jgi:probable phosphoglycerate mutase